MNNKMAAFYPEVSHKLTLVTRHYVGYVCVSWLSCGYIDIKNLICDLLSEFKVLSMCSVILQAALG